MGCHKLPSWASIKHGCKCGISVNEAMPREECDVSLWDLISSALDATKHDMSNITSNLNAEIEALVRVMTCRAPQTENMEFNEGRGVTLQCKRYRKKTRLRFTGPKLEVILEENECDFDESQVGSPRLGHDGTVK